MGTRAAGLCLFFAACWHAAARAPSGTQPPLHPANAGDQPYRLAITTDDPGDGTRRFSVSVAPKAPGTHAEVEQGYLTVRDGDKLISACFVQAEAIPGGRGFTFTVAAAYLDRSRFGFTVATADAAARKTLPSAAGWVRYEFTLRDFARPPGKPVSAGGPAPALLAAVGPPRPPAAAADPEATKPAADVMEIRGYLVPARRVAVEPAVAGRVIDLPVEEGARVKAGEVLARLDPAAHEAALRLAEAELRLAEAELSAAGERAGKADGAVGRARVDVARARVAAARLRLDGTVVRAPFDGTVLARPAEVGGVVAPLRFAGAAMRVCDLADLRVMDIEVEVPERHVGRVAPGQPCEVTVAAAPAKAYRGRVERVSPVADRAKGTVAVRVWFDASGGEVPLRPESLATVRFLPRE